MSSLKMTYLFDIRSITRKKGGKYIINSVSSLKGFTSNKNKQINDDDNNNREHLQFS